MTNPIRLGRAVTEPYLEDHDAGSSLDGPVLEIDRAIRCLSFQGYVTSGSPVGELKVQLSIIEDVWTDLEGCKAVKVDLTTNQDFMIIIPEQSSYAGKIRLVWTGSAESTGTFTVFQRIMPI